MFKAGAEPAELVVLMSPWKRVMVLEKPLVGGAWGGLWWMKKGFWGLAALSRICVVAQSPPEAVSSQMGVPSSSGELLLQARDPPGPRRCWLGFCRARLS